MPVSNLHQGLIAGAAGSAGGFAVDNSAMFNDDDTEYFTKTPSGAGNTKTWTVSFWRKLGKITTGSVKDTLFSARSASPYLLCQTNDGAPIGSLIFAQYNGSGYDFNLITDMIFRDPHAWYNIVIAVDTTQATDTNRVKIYVNGSQVTFGTASYPSQDLVTYWNTTYEQRLGMDFGTRPADGYLAEFVNIDGSALTPTSFGEFDDNAVWKPKDVTGLTFGTNGFYLDFETAGSDLGDDKSGNGNDFTNTNSVSQSADSPTKNMATLTPINARNSITFSNGNLKRSGGTSSQYSMSLSSQEIPSTGKWAMKFTLDAGSTSGTDAGNQFIGVITQNYALDINNAQAYHSGFPQVSVRAGHGEYTKNAVANGSFTTTYATGDTGEVLVDQDNQTVKFTKNDGTVTATITGVPTPPTHFAITHYDTNYAATVDFGQNGYTPSDTSYLPLSAANKFSVSTPTIADGSAYFQTTTYTGNGSTQTITQSAFNSTFQPDFIWEKQRNGGQENTIFDSVRGVTKYIQTDNTGAEGTQSGVTAFNSNGFDLGSWAVLNESGKNHVAWQWRAGGASPTKTYTVKVVSDSGNKYRFDDFGTSAVTLDLQEGGTYTFNLNDSSNDTHPFNIGTSANSNVYGSGILYYLDGVSVTNSAYNSGFTAATTRKIVFTVPASAPTLYYFCSSHSGMGGQINTNSTFGSSNFAGSVQSLVSSNPTAGFSICRLNPGGNSNITFGHELGAAPKWVLIKNLVDAGTNWQVFHEGTTAGHKIFLNTTAARASDSNMWQNTDPTSSVVSMGTAQTTNENVIAYCWAEVEGFSKFGVYTGNGNADGPVINTEFEPAWVMSKNYGTVENWAIWDNQRELTNVRETILRADNAGVETTGYSIDFLSNGFKLRGTDGKINGSTNTYIYMAFAKHPFAGSTPLTAH